MLVVLYGQVAVDTVYISSEVLVAGFGEAEKEITEFETVCIATFGACVVAVESFF